ncbi:MAG TPA: hypothetical protein VEZ14_06655 [Dehalococcoidia bacterium]|nr:hypothetical protein [Dehalococcoidia bacterium]
MSGYFGHSIVPVGASRWLRYWLTLRLYRRKIVFVGGKPYLSAPLTAVERAVIFATHLAILGAAVAASILLSLGAIRLLYG